MPIITDEVKVDASGYPKDLPESDGIPMESPWHFTCMMLLIDALAFFWRGRTDFFVGGNMFLYFSVQQALNRDYRGPDFFVVRGVDRNKPRTTWKIWEEGNRFPNVIVELLSPSTALEDRTTKKDLYEQTFRTPEYFLYDPAAKALEGWRLVAGRYEPLAPSSHGWLWSAELGLWLGTWEGTYAETSATWLRFYDAALQLVPARAEFAEAAAEAAQRDAEAAQRQAEKAEAKYARIQAWLAQQGLTPPTNGGSNS